MYLRRAMNKCLYACFAIVTSLIFAPACALSAGDNASYSAQASALTDTALPPELQTTTYPWANVPYPSSDLDYWGMYQRECVSYTAWKVSSDGKDMPNWINRGDAKKWPENARLEGIAVDSQPVVGSIAIDMQGEYGHAMYVEEVNGSVLTISEYNGTVPGGYSAHAITAAGLYFIHF